MVIIVVRTIIFYIVLAILMRLMGKRQIGEVSLTEFVAVVLLSELAALPITDRDIPLAHGLAPLIIISSIEIIIAYICRKSVKIRRFIDGKPIVLVQNGKIIEKNLTKTRVTPDEIESEIRVNGYRQIQEIDTVILEQTGKLSVLPKKKSGSSK
ncbi:MAG TPA: DUF421 domain-containing protein [Bacillota bacterium]|nr:DUF421 domain-containing protein [Bacillota bacterium]HOK68878.1 DUF421 domain-containing protein [Bacillota bacterium]HPP85675.1 DUF421 domain-containing protein [Bacillota bacterium]